MSHINITFVKIDLSLWGLAGAWTTFSIKLINFLCNIAPIMAWGVI